ncbi:MAG: hypothetical protein AAGK78_11140, partial [Planctomycetota bacterium]
PATSHRVYFRGEVRDTPPFVPTHPTMLKKLTPFAVALSLSLFAFATVGCEEDAADDINDGINDAVEGAQDAASDAGDAVKDAAEDAKDAAGDMMEDAENALNDAGEDVESAVEDE